MSHQSIPSCQEQERRRRGQALLDGIPRMEDGIRITFEGQDPCPDWWFEYFYWWTFKEAMWQLVRSQDPTLHPDLSDKMRVQPLPLTCPKEG